MKNCYELIADEKQVHPALVLATITGTGGSTPQKAGSSAIFGTDGLIAGTVGGGVLEGTVNQIAQKAIQSGKSGYYHFSLNNDISNEQEAICGGEVTILADASPAAHRTVFKQVNQSLREGIPGVLLTRLDMNGETLESIHRIWIIDLETAAIRTAYDYLVESAIRHMLNHGQRGDYNEILTGEADRRIIFLIEPLFPLPRLVIAGAGHIGKALAHLGALLDFSVTVVDERVEYANRENIPDANCFIVDDIGNAMQHMEKTPDTFIVIVTRGHAYDAEALRPCIGCGAAYVGLIGSSGKLAQMRKKFIEEGWTTPAQFDAVHAPIGITIGSKTVQEIAISIAAELIKVRNNKG